jgi:hypothetical protein
MAHFCGWNWFSPGLLPCLIHSPILLVRLLRAHTDWNIVIEMIKWLRHYPARRVTKLSFPPFSHTFRASKCTSLATPTLWLRPTRSTRFASDFGVRHRGPVGSIWHQYASVWWFILWWSVWWSVSPSCHSSHRHDAVVMAPGPRPFHGDPGRWRSHIASVIET